MGVCACYKLVWSFVIVVGVVTHEIVWFRGGRLRQEQLSWRARVGVHRDRPRRGDVLGIVVVSLVSLMAMATVHRVLQQGAVVSVRGSSFEAAMTLSHGVASVPVVTHRGQIWLLSAWHLEVRAEVAAVIHELVVLFGGGYAVDGQGWVELGLIHDSVRDKLRRVITSVGLVDVVGRCDTFALQDLGSEVLGPVIELPGGLGL